MLNAAATGPAGSAAGPSTRRLADAVWAEMQSRRVLPTPRNFTLWFTYRAEADAQLTKRMSELLAETESPDPETLDTLYDEHFAARPDTRALADSAAQIEEAARTLVEHIANSQAAADGYGSMLANVKVTLGGACTQDSLLRAVTTLVAETGRAAEHNRLLQEQLTAASARIVRLRQSLSVVRQEATTDALTGIANRKAFDARLRRAVRQARTEPFAISVMLFDIDHFKAFNDAYGHRTGDLVLRLVARVLADNVKGRDCAARYGGEEFGVILTNAELNAALVVARQISGVISGVRLVEDTQHGPCRITVSAGVAQYRPGEPIADLVERADQALYEAKRNGRNQVCAAPP
jgi:diguanylate cyclase